MNFAAPITATLQVVAAFLIFAAVYLALVVSAILCLVLTELIAEHASVFREFWVRPVALGTRLRSQIDGQTRRTLPNTLHFIIRSLEGCSGASALA